MNLVVLILRNASFRLYDRAGSLEREVTLYQRLARHGVRTSVVTWGDRRDLAYARRLGVRVLCNWPGWDEETYARRLVWLHAPWLMRADLLKAEQTEGTEVAVWCARRWRKPLIARSGFLWTEFCEHQFGPESPQAKEALRVSRMVYPAGDRVVVTTPPMKPRVTERYGVPGDRISVIPNYVDTQLFSPDPAVIPDPGSVLAVGRLRPEKNYAALIRAVADAGLNLRLVGSGSDEAMLRDCAAACGARVTFEGNVPNRELPALMRRACVFAQPSLTEGHPKTVIEAMACGMAVLGGDSPGVRDEVSHDVNGWLCATSREGIRDGLLALMENKALRRRLGVAAREHIVEEYALERVVALELALYRKTARIAGRKQVRP